MFQSWGLRLLLYVLPRMIQSGVSGHNSLFLQSRGRRLLLHVARRMFLSGASGHSYQDDLVLEVVAAPSCSFSPWRQPTLPRLNQSRVLWFWPLLSLLSEMIQSGASGHISRTILSWLRRFLLGDASRVVLSGAFGHSSTADPVFRVVVVVGPSCSATDYSPAACLATFPR